MVPRVFEAVNEIVSPGGIGWGELDPRLILIFLSGGWDCVPSSGPSLAFFETDGKKGLNYQADEKLV